MFDPFALLGLQRGYALDIKTLERHYFEEQKKTHPDRVAIDEKREAAKKSMALNQAYLLLKDPLKRAAFLLNIEGAGPLFQDPGFLGNVMVWNERLSIGEDIKSELQQEEKNLFKSLETAFEEKDYETAQQSLNRLTYVQKLLKEVGRKNDLSPTC